MPFPEAQRVIYSKNPLEQVICQLRFPTILRIDSEIPAPFQDRIRAEFPNFSETSNVRLNVPQGMKDSVPPEIFRQLIQSAGIKNYEFTSEDGAWKINLTRTFITLTANKYERWEKFADKLQLPLRALIDIYAPTNFSRIGLRYVDVINRSKLDLQDVGWSELLKTYILGILASPDIGENIKAFESRHDISLVDGQSTVRILTRFVEAEDTGELCFMIDSDFFTMNKTEIANVLNTLEFFRVRATRLFQWCITKRLHTAMGPNPI